MHKENIVLLFGGTSEERRVSVATAQNVAVNLEKAEFWFMNPEGLVFSVTKEKLLSHKNAFTEDFAAEGIALARNFEDACTKFSTTKPVFFLGLHGGEGEDGSLQRILEAKKFCFTGSGARASHQAFEKGISKEIAKNNGVRISSGIEFYTTDSKLESLLTDRFQDEGPQVIKPVDGGSSFGLFFLRQISEVGSISSSLRNLGNRRYLAESLIVGKELTIGVMNDGTRTFALPPSEVRTEKDRNFDYEGKYLGKGTLEITPAEISLEEAKSCQAIAVKMHTLLGCYGYSRTDMILTKEGPCFLETNTLPGLTKASFIPQQLEVAKIPFKEFIDTQLELAKKRYD